MLRGKVKKRIRCIYLCTMLIFACILSKLGYEQIIHHDAILERAMNLWQRDFAVGSLTVIKSKNIGKPLKYGFFFVKFLFLYVVCVVIMI